MRRIYFTKKRKREFDLAYSQIKSLKSAIRDLKYEAEIFLDNRNPRQAEQRLKLMYKFKDDLKAFAKMGWDTSSFIFFFIFLVA